MANYCHISYEDRKNIEDGLNERKSINHIPKEMNRSHSTILREIDINRIFTDSNNWTIHKSRKDTNYNFHCEKLDKMSYVCNGCPSRRGCKKERWAYYVDAFDDLIIGSDVKPFYHGVSMANHKNALDDMLNNKIKRGYKSQETIFHSD